VPVDDGVVESLVVEDGNHWDDGDLRVEQESGLDSLYECSYSVQGQSADVFDLMKTCERMI
jgi:hypothetical protein